MENIVDRELLPKSIVKQKKKPKNKTKSMSNDRKINENSLPHANSDSVEVIQKLAECLRIGNCENIINGGSEIKNNNGSCANNTKSCTDERNNCHNQSVVIINSDTNIDNEMETKQAYIECNNLNVCNGIGDHSISNDNKPSTSFASDIKPKSLDDINKGNDPITDNISNDPVPGQHDIVYKVYENELQMPDIMRLIQKDLSEPYSIYTYRYFIHNWPKLCFLAMHGTTCVGAIVCKLDIHRQQSKRGYIAMLAVDKDYRKLKIGTNLVAKAIQAMLVYNADEVVLETEITNIPALRLYENLGFVRDKRLFGYYLNGVDALRLKLWFR